MMRFTLPWMLCLGLLQASLAGLVFEKDLVELNAPADATRVDARFRFTNQGQKPVRIAEVDPDCSCLEVEIKDGKLIYAPGESGEIRATFDIGNSSGAVDQAVAVWLDDDPKDRPSLHLKVRIHVPELVSLTPKSLRWQTGDPSSTRSIRVAINHSEPIHITGIHSTSDNFTAELKTMEPGKLYEIEVTPTDTSRPSMALLRIDTDSPVEKQKAHQAFAMILRPASEVQSEP